MFIERKFYLDAVFYETDLLMVFLDGYLLWPSKYKIIPGSGACESSFIQFAFRPHNGQWLCINNMELNTLFYYEFKQIEGELELVERIF
jgi:hypothetical protein